MIICPLYKEQVLYHRRCTCTGMIAAIPAQIDQRPDNPGDHHFRRSLSIECTQTLGAWQEQITTDHEKQWNADARKSTVNICNEPVAVRDSSPDIRDLPRDMN